MKIAIVHDWLVTFAGAEKVLEKILEIYPDADIYSVVDFLDDDKRKLIQNKRATVTFIQKLPFAKKKYRNYLPLMPLAIEQLNLSKYDVIISSSHAVAKGVITGPDQLHISYVHSPIRYAWDLQHQYLEESGLNHGLKGLLARYLLHKIRIWDARTTNSVDYLIANSSFIARRIWKCYRREAEVIYPPVDVNSFNLHTKKEEFYLTASRMVPYKKIDLIVESFNKMPDKKLVVIGDGPDFHKIKSIAGSNIYLMGYQPFEVLREYMQKAKAFVFAAEEDFGIVPVEAQACGTPVIAYGKGGALETVRDISNTKPTGVFFKKQTPESIIEAVKIFEDMREQFSPYHCRENAETFSVDRFKREFSTFIQKRIDEKFNSQTMIN
ncbi:glycosyltransferase family 4 protein [Aeribacillus pallidus]|jgi:glycosyltransferase involved in cell wall biosynthesis|uniref:glycosyltransferase family 4 protein n=1 Tax=Aeribacillus TaxID=1055323 RepID=UPI0007B4EE05|nr:MULTISPECIES: glycosyltransferase family 4 protein [Aeribacillus]KZM55122.1 glycosyl transferase family 1 [Aeribacillus pallidus]MED0650949.1 glycosyltransferase family 4 protein [Aeribacillus composti]MED4488518.1 glycosyltransferase family 4 protein [Aeribacillus pallidus]